MAARRARRGARPPARPVALHHGDHLPYDGLVIASGASPRRLPGPAPARRRSTSLRSVDDSLGLRADLDAGVERVVVIGAGFIGAEVAATCRRRGHDVTMVEPLEQPLVRVLGAEMGTVVADLHRRNGVDLRLGVGVEAIEGNDRVERVRLSDGSVMDADVVVVGIGVVPNTAWLEGSGLPLDDGVLPTPRCLVAPGIVACGDVARWDSPRYGPHPHRALGPCGRHGPGRRPSPGRGRRRGRGLRSGALVLVRSVRRADPGRGPGRRRDGRRRRFGGDSKFVALYGRDGQVRAALGWNWPAKTVRYRMAMEEGLAWADAVG